MKEIIKEVEYIQGTEIRSKNIGSSTSEGKIIGGNYRYPK